MIGSNDQPIITWLDDGVEIFSSDTSRNVSATTMNSDGNYSNTLTFNPLSVSHAAIYVCRAMAGEITQMESITVSVNGEHCSNRSRTKCLTIFWEAYI